MKSLQIEIQQIPNNQELFLIFPHRYFIFCYEEVYNSLKENLFQNTKGVKNKIKVHISYH